MSEPQTDPGRRAARADSHAAKARARTRPATDAAIPVADNSDDVLDHVPSPTDESPTVVSKNASKTPPATDDGIRGRRLAHFELLEQIGVGGMAAVLRAR